MADKTQNVKTRLSFDGEAEYKAACKEINSALKVLNSEMKLVTAEYKDNASSDAEKLVTVSMYSFADIPAVLYASFA